MVKFKNVLLLLSLITTWSCKENGLNQVNQNSLIEKVSPDSVITSSENLKDSSYSIVENNDNKKDIQKTSSTKTSKPSGDSGNKIDKSNRPIDFERPALKPKTETIKEIKPDVEVKDNSKLLATKFVNHQIFDQQLKKYVSSGKVNYAAWKRDMEGLNEYLLLLSSVQNIDIWSYEERLAFWINTYNAFTIKLVLDHYPIKSIKDINNGKPWDERFIQVGNTVYSLNEIENGIIRKKYGEPRIHFALNCAAKSCPILYSTAFTKENLSKLLETNTNKFINGSQNKINIDMVELSSIFDWYGSDFEDLLGFVTKYANVKPNSNAKISFKAYDWSLNE